MNKQDALRLCSKCNVEKPATAEFFYKEPRSESLLRRVCKKCFLSASSEYASTPNGAAKRKAFAEKNRANAASSREKYRVANQQEISEKQRVRRIEKIRQYEAHCAVTAALKSGKLKKEPCFVCGDERSEGHHADYDNKLGVSWLCKMHHAQLHAEFARPQHPLRVNLKD